MDLCQAAVHLTFTSSAGHCLIGRRLYFTRQQAGKEERRELTGAPDELCLVAKPRLAADMFHAASNQSGHHPSHEAERDQSRRPAAERA
ncbi:hypothetical protein GCM10010121_099600 [Streptomyces brasiliensis]|uniref:Uncharacterized protein n=1 Tax=Streptomyces brasiliensis TaxID=1954 RepID=A0A917UPH7_9ACTN|nr:hypothetical protein GCM10010121_099600 [Streptomyces brasiliensis]